MLSNVMGMIEVSDPFTGVAISGELNMLHRWNRQKTNAITESGVWIFLAIAVWILSSGFSEEYSLFRWGADFWPRAVAILMAALALISFVTALASPSAEGVSSANAGPNENEARQSNGIASYGGTTMVLKYGATFLIPILYVYLLPRAGYFAATPFFIISMVYIFGVRRPSLLFVAPLAFYVLTVVVFSKVLYVPLAQGYWPSFYQFSNLILDWVR